MKFMYCKACKGIFHLKIFVFSLIISSIFLVSCNDEANFLGRDLLPPGDDIQTFYSSDESIMTKVVEGKPIITSANSEFLLGSYRDPVFGLAKADFLTRIDVASGFVDGSFSIDSLVLSLSLNSYFGDSMQEQTLRVYELTDSLDSDTTLYSDIDPLLYYDPANEIAQATFLPTDTLIRMVIENQQLIDKFSSAEDSIFNDGGDFRDFFFGFYITTDTTESGAIVNIDLPDSDTRLSMHYTDPDTTESLVVEMRVGEFTPRVNTFNHFYSGSRIGRLLASAEQQDTLIFTSAMGGANTSLMFPEIEDWLLEKPIAINKAQLYIPVADSTIAGLSSDQFPQRLSLFFVDDEDNYNFLYDYQVDDSQSKSYFNGIYSSEENAYVFNIGVHLQSFIQGDIDDLNLILVTGENTQSAKRIVLKGSNALERNMQLRITYSTF